MTRRLLEPSPTGCPPGRRPTRGSRCSPGGSARSCAPWPAGSPAPGSAAAPVLSELTVKTHVARILGKLDLRDRTQAAVFAHTHGLA